MHRMGSNAAYFSNSGQLSGAGGGTDSGTSTAENTPEHHTESTSNVFPTERRHPDLRRLRNQSEPRPGAARSQAPSPEIFLVNGRHVTMPQIMVASADYAGRLRIAQQHFDVLRGARDRAFDRYAKNQTGDHQEAMLSAWEAFDKAKAVLKSLEREAGPWRNMKGIDARTKAGEAVSFFYYRPELRALFPLPDLNDAKKVTLVASNPGYVDTAGREDMLDDMLFGSSAR